jgi:polyhydroxybutyrate depolymerase
MRRLLPLLWLFALILVVAPVAAQDAPVNQFDQPGGYTLRFMVGGVERRIHVFIPPSYDFDGEPVPLLMALHGAGGTGAGLSSFSGFNQLADEQGFIVVYPDGYNGAWNDARPSARTLPIDDVRFLSLTIDFLVDQLRIDTDRVYAAGYSMGGMMAFRLGCQLPDKIAGVASVASTFPAYQLDACLFAEPVPVLVIQGTEDTVIPAEGYRDQFGNRMMLSVDETMRYWSDVNECASGVRLQFLADADPGDGTRVRRETYDDCAAGAELLRVTGGGHTWPGHPFQAPLELGATSLDVDASAEIWRFFAAQSRR